MADGPRSANQIIETAFEDRVRELFKTFAEAVYTGEAEAASTARFRRGLESAKKVRAMALAAAQELDGAGKPEGG